VNTLELLKIPYWIASEREALVYEGRRITYGDLMERVNKLTVALSNLGVAQGSKVAVLQTNCNEYIETYFATAALGGVMVPLNFRARQHELEHMLRDSESEVLFFGDRYLALVEAMKADLPRVAHYIAMESPQAGYPHYPDLLAAVEEPDMAAALEAEVDDTDLSVLMYTSGTTALPKGVMLTAGGFMGHIMNAAEPDPEAPPTATLLSAPFYHIAGFSSMLIGLYGLRRLVVMRQFDPKQWLQLAQDEKVTHVFLVPTMMRQLIEHPDFSQYDLSSLQSITYGGAPMPVPVIQRGIEQFPKHVSFVNAFGQTETLSTVTALGPEDHRLEGTEQEIEVKLRRLGSIGRAVGDVVVQIIDDDGKELPRETVGEIAILVPRAMAGYWKQEEATSNTLVDGWIRTRDMGWMDEGGYLFLAGRKSDMIIRGGENVAPEQVEAILYTHPKVEDAAVIGVPDDEWGEEVIAIVVPKRGVEATQEELIAYARERIAAYPRAIFFAEDLPRNPLGKVLKNVLRDEYKTAAPAR
jgi:acyl-CoA synthetase (AMP-forming)/AMP-acid ligase II